MNSMVTVSLVEVCYVSKQKPLRSVLEIKSLQRCMSSWSNIMSYLQRSGEFETVNVNVVEVYKYT